MEKTILVSYYTKNYEKYAPRLIKSCIDFKVMHHVQEIKDIGSWQSNTNYKPIFIRECLEKFPGQNILWVDVDAEVKRHLDYFDYLDEKADIGVHYRQPNKMRTGNILSGTIFLKNNAIGMRIIDLWISEINRNPNTWDQYNLQSVLFKHNDFLKIELIPASYCCIYDLMIESGEVKEVPHIVHYAASREFNPEHPMKGKWNRTAKLEHALLPDPDTYQSESEILTHLS